MQLRFWLRPLSLGLYVHHTVKSQKLIYNFSFFTLHYIVDQRIEVEAEARTGAPLCWCVSGKKNFFISGSGFNPYPWTYIVNK
jgi:hypothetical protein